MKGTLAAPCLLLLAATVRADEPSGLDSDAVLRSLIPYILSTDAMRDEKRVIIPMVVEDRTDGSSAIFDRDANRIVINRKILEAAYSELKSCANYPKGTPPDDILALHLLPTVAHELRHVLLNKVIGGTVSNQDDEVSAYIETMAVYHEIRGRNPGRFACSTYYTTANYQISERFWKPEGVAGLRKFVEASPYYKQMCAVTKTEDVATCRRLAASAGGKEQAFWGSDEKIAQAKQRYEEVEFPRGRRIFEEQKRAAENP